MRFTLLFVGISLVSCGGEPQLANKPPAETCANLRCYDSQTICVTDADGARCEACAEGSYALESGSCKAIGGTVIAHDFPMQTIQSGSEQTDNCRSWTLDNDEDLWVNAVEFRQDELSHHTRMVYVPDTIYAGPDGIWPCSDRSFEFYGAVAAGGVVFSQSTQASAEVQKFPDGAAVRIPAHSRIASDIHLINTGTTPNTGHARLVLHTIDASEAKVKLKAFHVEYDALDIPPQSSARFTAHCAIASDFTASTMQPFAPTLYYLLPHTHTHATRFFASVLGGKHDGEALLDLGTFNGEAHGRSFDPPLDMSDSIGFTFGCQYTNSSGDEIGWGVGKNEMCELFGFADTTAFFQSRVNKGVTEGTANGVILNQGDCDNQIF